MRITQLKLKAFRGYASEFTLSFDNAGKNLLIYGENGAAKSSLSRALEMLLDPVATRSLAEHQNLFTTTPVALELQFRGRKAGRDHDETLSWTSAGAKPLPSWLLSSAARSAFLDHRKLLLLSDRNRDLSESFFQTAVQHLFAHLSAGTGGNTVGALWEQIQTDLKAYVAAQRAPEREAATGVTDPAARHTPIENAVNALNQALTDYLTPRGTATKPDLVAEAERLLSRFEDVRLSITLDFEQLTFNRNDGTLSGGRLVPHVTYCAKDLGMLDGAAWKTNHHHILNEARLTALALVLFFAAVRLQDRVPYIAGTTDPENPARLLVLDDVLVGLDYEHRIPVLEIIREDFAKDHRYQVVLLTHNRVWFDVCRLQMEASEWKIVEIFAKRGQGPDGSDFPIRKESATDLIKRAEEFYNANEYPAAANYARTALELALKTLCAKRSVPVPFTLEPEKYKAETFLNALADVTLKKHGTWLLIPKTTQKQLAALRTTVLNPLSHPHSTTITGNEVNKTIMLAKRLTKIASKLKSYA